MELVRWNPVRNMFGLRHNLNRVFDDFYFPFSREDDELAVRNWDPVVDVYDNDDNIVLKAELPGVDKKDIEVDVKGRVLTLKGERSSDNKMTEDHYYRRERCFGKFERAFNLPVDVELDKIKANYKDGVLEVEIPKPEEKKPKQITVH